MSKVLLTTSMHSKDTTVPGASGNAAWVICRRHRVLEVCNRGKTAAYKDQAVPSMNECESESKYACLGLISMRTRENPCRWGGAYDGADATNRGRPATETAASQPSMAAADSRTVSFRGEDVIFARNDGPNAALSWSSAGDTAGTTCSQIRVKARAVHRI